MALGWATLAPTHTLFSPAVLCSTYGGQESSRWSKDEVRTHWWRSSDASQRVPCIQTKWVYYRCLISLVIFNLFLVTLFPIVWLILHGAPTELLFQPVLHEWYNKGCCVCYPVCGMVPIKELLLLIRKSNPCSSSIRSSFSLSEWSFLNHISDAT